MKNIESKSENITDESLKPTKIFLSVIGLSGSCQVKGIVGVGKSSICNRLVRPENFNHKQLSTLSSVDFYGDVINGTDWIYWNHIVEMVDSKVYEFHIIEQTVLVSDQTFLPFENCTESDYVSRAISDKLVGSKRAFISPSPFSRSPEQDSSSSIDSRSTIDAFLVVFDVSEVTSRDYQAQDRCVTKLLSAIQKSKKPIVIALSKTDLKSSKIRARFDTIVEKHGFKSIPIIETSAKLNINISLIPSIVISELQQHQRSLSLKIAKKTFKYQTFDEVFAIKKEMKENSLKKFRHLVNAEVTKAYDLSWQSFSACNELSNLSSLFDRSELIYEYESCKATTIMSINESLMSVFVVLFKKTLTEFITPILSQSESVNEDILSSLLHNLKFLCHFQDEEVSETKIFQIAHSTNHIDYPLPRFLISSSSPQNKLHLIDSCIDEIKFQKIELNFTNELLRTFESNPELFEDKSFGDIENIFKDQQLWNRFRKLAKTIFAEFVEKRIAQFKVIFDEKLLELSIMIFLCVPVQTCMSKCNINEKGYKEKLPDMELINGINNKIYFDHQRFDKKIYQEQRIKWVVKYIGSLISSNPCQCYHFDFCSDLCQNNLQRYLDPCKVYVRSVTIVISLDEIIDENWKTKFGDDAIFIDDKFSSIIEFIPSSEFTEDHFWNRQLSSSQKIFVLIHENRNDAYVNIEKFLAEHVSNSEQLSIIDVELSITNSSVPELQSLVVRMDGYSSSISQSVVATIKDQTISYINQSEPVVIWLVVLCDDKYDSSIPLAFLLSLFDDCIIIEQHVDRSVASVSIVYTVDGMVIPQRLIVTVLSYHQAFKLLNEECQCNTLHLLLYFCDLHRLASMNTLLAVMQNLIRVVNVESVICAIKSVNFTDDDFVGRKNSLTGLAVDSGARCFIIENEEGRKNDMNTDALELRSIIANCVAFVNRVDKNQCKYNVAYENEDFTTAIGTKNGQDCWKSAFYKEKFGKNFSNDNIHQNFSFGSRDRTFSNSDSLISPDMTSSDPFFAHENHKTFTNFEDVDCFDSVPLGSFNEHLFCSIKEENGFDDNSPDDSTIVLIRCTNFKHIGSDDLVKVSSNFQHNSKFRSFSGPVQSNKSFSRKYSSVQNPFSRSQRYSTKKTQSLTTSPVTSYMKSSSQNQIVCNLCKGNNEYCASCHNWSTSAQNHSTSTSKTIKNVFSRLFSSERCSNKSAEEKRGIFSRSMRSSKKNSQRRNKNLQAANSSSERLCDRNTPMSASFVASVPHSIPVSDSRNRTISLSKTVFTS